MDLPNPTHPKHHASHGQGDDGGYPYSNKIKQHNNMRYCYSCGYGVNHMGNQCLRKNQGCIPNVPRGKAHLVPGTSMKASTRRCCLMAWTWGRTGSKPRI